MGKVTVWQMTPEQLEEYKQKHPVRPTEKPKRSDSIDHIDYQWRSKKANQASQKK